MLSLYTGVFVENITDDRALAFRNFLSVIHTPPTGIVWQIGRQVGKQACRETGRQTGNIQ